MEWSGLHNYRGGAENGTVGLVLWLREGEKRGGKGKKERETETREHESRDWISLERG